MSPAAVERPPALRWPCLIITPAIAPTPDGVALNVARAAWLSSVAMAHGMIPISPVVLATRILPAGALSGDGGEWGAGAVVRLATELARWLAVSRTAWAWVLLDDEGELGCTEVRAPAMDWLSRRGATQIRRLPWSGWAEYVTAGVGDRMYPIAPPAGAPPIHPGIMSWLRRDYLQLCDGDGSILDRSPELYAAASEVAGYASRLGLFTQGGRAMLNADTPSEVEGQALTMWAADPWAAARHASESVGFSISPAGIDTAPRCAACGCKSYRQAVESGLCARADGCEAETLWPDGYDHHEVEDGMAGGDVSAGGLEPRE